MVKRIVATAFAAVALAVSTAGAASAARPNCPGGSEIKVIDGELVEICLKNGRKL
jgi:hypothetical protein